MEEICELVNCERASIFMLDELNGTLWSKAAKGVEPIWIPKNAGIVGHVVKNWQVLNIDDAYKEPMFNKDFDILNNYKTKTILCVPIID